LTFLPKKTRDNMVRAQLVLRFGNEKSLKDHDAATQFLGNFMLLGGTKNHTYQQIVDEVNKWQAGIILKASSGQFTCTFASKKENFPQLLRLVREILREPAFADAPLDLLKRQLRESFESARTEPAALADIAVESKLNPFPKGDIRYTPTFEEMIREVNAFTVDEFRK